jgi:NAD(P)-dependent dehydrogenase (short-subunit alcohol dehydrogenase family)
MKTQPVFLISGGAKGITAKCAIKLAQHQSCKFILLGRSALTESEPEFAQDCFDDAALKKRIMDNLISQGEKPTPISVQKIFNQISSNREIKQTLSSIKQAGNEVEYISADVTNVIALQEKIAAVVERTGAITGIIHGAGVLADKYIEKKTAEDFENVYAAKVKGLENLLSCVNIHQLQHLVLFSSVAGFYGNIGQSDYAIANEILNKTAQLIQQRYSKCHVVSINWGAWDSGMVTPELKKVLKERKVEIIPIDVGTQMLVNELADTNKETAQVVIGSPLNPSIGDLDNELKSYRIRRQLTLEDNPFVLDHSLGGYGVLPATCALAWMINLCEQIYPGYRFTYAHDFRILKGIIFNEALPKEHIVDLQEISKINAQHIEFQAKILSKTESGKTHYHFSANIVLAKEVPEAPIYDAVNLNWDENITGTGQYFYSGDGAKLFHGVSFQQVKRALNINQEKITTECVWNKISDKQQGQFPLQWVNPYALDLCTHAIWIWLQHFYEEGCLPGTVDKYEQFAEMPCNKTFYVSCEIKDKTATRVTADFIIHDAQGKIFSRITGTKAVVWSMKS